jgi:hypothetical protein
MRKLGAVVSLIVVVGITAASPAAAKGQPRGFNFDGYSVPGQRLSSVELLDIHGRRFLERAPYFAYLQNMGDAWVNFRWPSPSLDGPIPLGKVNLRPFRYRGERRVEARLSFAVPEVPRGLYEVVVCNAGCAHRGRRLGPTGLYIVSGTVERRLRAEIDRLYSEVWRMETRVWRLENRLRRSARGWHRGFVLWRKTMLERDRDLVALRARLPDRTGAEDSLPVTAAAVGGAVAGIAAYAGVALARSRRAARRRSG